MKPFRPSGTGGILKALLVGQKVGSLNGTFTVHTSDSLMPAIEIRVYGSVQE